MLERRPRGTLITGDQTINYSSTDTGFKAIGNPYASTINFTGLSKNLVSENYYMWNPRGASNGIGAYITLSPNGLINPDGTTAYEAVPNPQYGAEPIDTVGNIQSGQGFVIYVDASNNSKQLVIHETDKKDNNSNAVFRRPTGVSGTIPAKLRINLYSGNELADGVLEVFDEKYSNAADLMEDAKKLNNMGENLSIQRDGQYLAIEKRKPVNINDTIFLAPYSMKEQQYQLEIIPTDLVLPNQMAFLEDRYTNKRTPVDFTNTTVIPVNFDANPASKALDRLRIIFAAAEGGALPVTYSSVRAWRQNKDIAVEWKVENELNIKEYEVEASANGRNFAKVNTTTAKGNSRTGIVYNWLDLNATAGDHYYRIRSIGLDGKNEYSSVVKVSVGKGNTGIAVYPNPVKDGKIGLQFNNMPAGEYTVRLLNTIGQVLLVKEIQHSGGNATNVITEANTVVKGIYRLEVINPDKSKTSLNVLCQ